MNFFTEKKIISICVIAVFLSVGFLCFPNFTNVLMNDGEMPIDHSVMLQAISSVLPVRAFDVFVLLLAVIVGLFWKTYFHALLFFSAKQKMFFQKKIYRFLFRSSLEEAFSRGILHPKIYTFFSGF
ncbi:MAG: hypothetical protein AAB362_01605 [Patescibacteria group bacterium]